MPEYRDRLTEQVEASVATLDQARGTQRDTQRPGPPETACHLERRPGQPPALSLMAEHGMRDRCLRLPGIQAIDDPEPLASLTTGQEVPQRFLASSLSHAKLAARHQVGGDHDRV